MIPLFLRSRLKLYTLQIKVAKQITPNIAPILAALEAAGGGRVTGKD
jgi:hypothetical protein